MSLSRKELLERSIKLRRRERSRRRYLSLFLAALALILIVFLVEAPWLRVQTVAVSGNKVVPTSEIVALVESLTAGRYFYLIPKNHILWYPTESVRAGLLSVIPRLHNVSVYRQGFTAVEVAVEERSPLALWCVGESRDKCFFIDQAGLVYAPAPWFSSALFFEVRATSAPAVLPAEPVPAIHLLKLARFAEAGQALLGSSTSTATRFESAELLPAGDAAFTVRQYGIGAPLSWQLRLNLDQDLLIAGRNLASVWHSNAFQKEFGAKRGRLEYIDIRFGNKVFYKFAP